MFSDNENIEKKYYALQKMFWGFGRRGIPECHTQCFS